MNGTVAKSSAAILPTLNEDNPTDEVFIFKHFYNNKKGLIKQHMKEEKEA